MAAFIAVHNLAQAAGDPFRVASPSPALVQSKVRIPHHSLAGHRNHAAVLRPLILHSGLTVNALLTANPVADRTVADSQTLKSCPLQAYLHAYLHEANIQPQLPDMPELVPSRSCRHVDGTLGLRL